MDDNIYGIWIGEDSVVAIAKDLMIAFLRLKDNLTVSVLRCNDLGVMT